ncbi:MAG: DUF5667 domain-containing protein [Patescibacteria group bacterium]
MNKRILCFMAIGLIVILFSQFVFVKAEASPTADLITVSSPANAEPIISPTSPFYFLKNLGQSIKLALTFNQTKKAKLELKYADENIVALKKVCNQGKCDSIEKYLKKFEGLFQKGISRIEKTQQGGKEVGDIVEQLKENHLRQQDVLGKVLEKAPESARPGILNAIEKSSFGLENAINKIEGQEKANQFREKLNLQLNNLGEATKNKIKEKIQSKIQEKTNLIEQRLDQPDAAPIKELRDTLKQQGEPLYQQRGSILKELENQVNTLKNQDSKKIIPATLIFFYGSSCSHCQKVEKYFTDNKIAEKIKFDQKEVYANPKNSALLVQYAKKCGINENEIGVPLLWDGSKCLVGDQPIIDYFQSTIGLK